MESRGDTEAAVLICGECGDSEACVHWSEKVEEEMLGSETDDDEMFAATYAACSAAADVESDERNEHYFTLLDRNYRDRVSEAF